MSYNTKVKEKIQNSVERPSERIELWRKVVIAYEQGGVEQVRSMLAGDMQLLKTQFEGAFDKLQKML